MTFPPLDWIGILAAIVAAMVVGSLWYAPFGFMKPWLRGIEKTQDQLGSPAGPMALMLVMTAIKVIGVAVLMGWLGWAGVKGGLMAALAVWVIGVLPTQAMEVAFENRPKIL